MPDPRWEIERTDAGYHTRLRAANGEILVSSEVLNRLEDAERNIGAVEEIIAGDRSGIHTVLADHRTIRT